MSIALLNPLALFALGALLVPLLLHLTRRSEQRPTPFAALRWLDARVRPKRRLSVDEWLLLLLRLLLVTLAALLLARPVLNGGFGAPAHYAAVAPGVDVAAARAALSEAADWHWLAPGFPALAQPAPGAVPVASLLRELDARLPTTTRVTVFVPEQLGGLDGAPAQLRHALDWRVLPGASPVSAPVPHAKVRLSVRYPEARAAALRYARASVAAWNAHEPDCCTLDAAPLATALSNDGGWLLWLGEGTTPALDAWITAGGVAVVEGSSSPPGEPVWRDDAGTVLARATAEGRGRRIALAGTLQADALPQLLDPDFPDHLRALYSGEPLAPTRAHAESVAPLAGGAGTMLAVSLEGPLALVIALLFLLERLLATGARLKAAA